MQDDRDELIEAQKQVIGILFEVVKRLQANNDLDEEYFGIVSGGGDRDRLEKILEERRENAAAAGKLLERLDTRDQSL